MSLLMALPVLALFLLGSPRAQAQDLARTLPTWAVLDFANPSGYGSTDVGRLAADSFVVELAKLNRYSVLPRQDLLNAITSNNLTPPLNLTSIEKVGQSLGASAIVAGEISSVSFSQDRRQAKVSIVVRVIDPRSGYLLNGALAEGSSNVRPIPVSDEESLVNEAFANAGFNAVKQISKFNLPVATVLIGRGVNSVTLNKGSRDGLYNGLDMLVTRNGVVTGTIKVSDVSNNDANAVVTDQGQGIRPEDRATAIYTLPSYSIDKSVGSFRTASSGDVSSDSPTHKKKSNFFSGVGGILVALLAGALIISATNQGHSSKSLGGAAVQGPHAVAGRATLVGGAQSTTVPTGISLPQSLYVPVAVRITSDVGNINPNNFLEYHVYRSDAPAVLSSPAALGIIPTQGGGNNNNNNNNNNNGGNNGSTFSFGAVPLFAQAGHGNLLVYDGPVGISSITASKPNITDSTQLLTVTASTVVAAATTTGIVTLGQPLPGTGLNLGQRVFYQVEGLYIQPATTGTGILNPGTNGNNNGGNNNNNNNNGGNNNNNNNNGGNNNNNNNNNGGNNNNNNGGNNGNNNNTGTSFGHQQTYQLTGLRQTNYITLIEPVTPSANAATGTGLNNVNFTIPATRGGTDYVLEISTDPGFANPKRYAPQAGSYNAPITNPTNFGITVSAATGTAVIFNNIDLTTAFPNASQFFYRIGARDLLNGGSEGDNPYIFNDPLPVNLNGGATSTITALLSGNARRQTQQRQRPRF